MENISFYCINFDDEDRKIRMIQRFKNQQIDLNFVKPVYIKDSRIKDIPVCDSTKRIMSIMLQHLDSIRDFYENTEKEYCIICEDDILISKYMSNELPNILENFNELHLDVLLLGYLLPFTLTNDNPEFALLKQKDNFKYFDFPYNLWGSQMYLINKKHAKFLLEKYTIAYALEDLNRPYNPDWTLTKDGKKAIVYPMLGLEEGTQKSDHAGQDYYHRLCFEVNYDKDIYF